MEYDDSNTNALLTPQNPNEVKVFSKNLIYLQTLKADVKEINILLSSSTKLSVKRIIFYVLSGMYEFILKNFKTKISFFYPVRNKSEKQNFVV